ncbi:MAG: magnesium chelatase domain-containing protein, partial [Pseudobdellovibrionaceae bacterium]
MVVHSFVTHQGSLVPIEVELVLVPGLPQIHFLGLPDQHIRESTERIKCALKKQGFEFPKSQQVLVNLRPSYVKKKSRGAELAVAA